MNPRGSGRSSPTGYHDYEKNPIQIEAFGSIRFGLATSTSDLDLVLLDPYRPNGFETDLEPTLPELYDTKSVAKVLKSAGFRKVQPIPFSKVPIVKFEAKINGELIQADICTNERLGQFFDFFCERVITDHLD